jgi:hypothetical protein
MDTDINDDITMDTAISDDITMDRAISNDITMDTSISDDIICINVDQRIKLTSMIRLLVMALP